MKVTIKITKNSIAVILLIFSLIALGVNQYLLFLLSSKLAGETWEMQTQANIVQQIYDKIPKDGEQTEYGLVFSTSGLETLVDFYTTLELTSEEWDRFIDIGTSSDTACEYCCGMEERGSVDKDGNVLCGCAHNVALAGLVKYLVKQGYSDEEIFNEIQRWKAYFFPRGYVTETLQEMGISPEAVGLPAQRGGC